MTRVEKNRGKYITSHIHVAILPVAPLIYAPFCTPNPPNDQNHRIKSKANQLHSQRLQISVNIVCN